MFKIITKYRFIAILGMFFSTLVVTGLVIDDDKLSGLLDRLASFTKETMQEKVHLHFDKPYYSLGDDIWFKGYIVNAEENKLSDVSKVLYIDLIDSQDSIRKTIILPIVNGLCNGNVKLSDSLFTTGNYHIRAYTNWMQNFDQSYFFHKTIAVGNALNENIVANATFNVSGQGDNKVLNANLSFASYAENPEVNRLVVYKFFNNGNLVFTGKGMTDQNGKVAIDYPLKKQYSLDQLSIATTIYTSENIAVSRKFNVNAIGSDIDVKFFPEGGNLVFGLRSKVAFKALSHDGFGAAVTGYIEDKDKNKVAVLEAEHLGMGIFSLTPVVGNNYTAVINTVDGRQKRFSLPAPINEGYVMSLNHIDEENLLLRVQMTAALANTELILITQSNGISSYANKIKMDKSVVSVKLPKHLFSNGIVQFTLFDAAYNPIAERLIYIRKKEVVDAAISFDKKQFLKREKVEMGIHVKDDQGVGLVGSFSVAVIHQDKVNLNEDDELGIQSNILLTSDLKGFIEKPNYYFTNVNPQKEKHLDMLLLSQGWRRFSWETIKKFQKFEPKFEAEKGLSVTGTIKTLGSNKPVPFGKVSLLIPSLVLLIDTVADENGRFVFDNLDFPDSLKFIVRAKNAKDKNNVKIQVDEKVTLSTHGVQTPSYELGSQKSLINYLNYTDKMYTEMKKYGLIDRSITLKEVKISGKKKPVIEKSALPAQIQADYTLTPENLQTSGSVTGILSGLAGVHVKYFPLIGNVVLGFNRGVEGRLLILLDGIPIDNIDGIDPRSLAGIEVIRAGSNSIGAGLHFQNTNQMGDARFGIVFLTLENKATKYNTTANKALSSFKPKGYSITKEFYAPTYDVKNNNEMLDLRSTIYWNPNLITDEKGNVNFNFFTADETGKYLVILEGVTVSGGLVRKVYVVNVK